MRTFIHTFGLLFMMTVASSFVNYTVAVIDYAYNIHLNTKEKPNGK